MILFMKIIIPDNMIQEVLSELEKLGTVVYKPQDLSKEIKDCEVLIVRSATKVTKELLSHAKKLKVVARAGVGTDNIDSNACKSKGITVINTPSASTNAVAELTISFILSLLRNTHLAHASMKSKKWEKKKFVGQEASGKTLGIIGFGRIGNLVGQKAKCLGMNIIAYDPKPVSSSNVKFVDLETLLRESDLISLHTILVPETKEIINAKTISKMKDGVFLINVARGELVNEQALYDSCKSGKIAGAAIDVYQTEPYTGKLLELENIFFTPHLGASTNEAQLRIGKELVEKLREWCTANR